MTTLLHSEIFFFISSIGFIIVWILIVILLIHIIRLSRTLSRIMNRIEKNVDTLSDTTNDMLLDIQESTLFQFLFGKKRKGRKNTSTHSE